MRSSSIKAPIRVGMSPSLDSCPQRPSIVTVGPLRRTDRATGVRGNVASVRPISRSCRYGVIVAECSPPGGPQLAVGVSPFQRRLSSYAGGVARTRWLAVRRCGWIPPREVSMDQRVSNGDGGPAVGRSRPRRVRKRAGVQPTGAHPAVPERNASAMGPPACTPGGPISRPVPTWRRRSACSAQHGRPEPG
jgi:hypothetical protein